MRIGTWNLAGRWSERHAAHLVALDCDLLLLTEVHPRTSVAGYGLHLSEGRASSGQHWSAVAARSQVSPLPSPHLASAMAQVSGLVVCSSVLPWRGCGTDLWGEGDLTAKMRRTLDALSPALTGIDVWGGDWNSAFSGEDWTSSRGARAGLHKVLGDLRLQVPTAILPSQRPGVRSIDHVAVPERVPVVKTEHVVSAALSDHDAYVVLRTPTEREV